MAGQPECLKMNRTMLLHIARLEVQDIFLTFTSPGTKYNQAVTTLNNNFKPKKHIQFEIHMFGKAKQHDKETIDDFYCEGFKSKSNSNIEVL